MIWAKSERQDKRATTLQEHTRDVLQAFFNLKDKIPNENLSSLITIAIACHDFGKALPAFQIKSLKNRSYQPYFLYNNIPHSLFSYLWINQEQLKQAVSNLYPNQVSDYVQFINSVVAYHHWRESFPDYLQPGNSEMVALCEKMQGNDFVKTLHKNLIHEIEPINPKLAHLIGFNFNVAEGLKNGISLADYVTPPYQLYWLPQRMEIDQSKYKDCILIAGTLMRCDHFASYCESENLKNEDATISEPVEIPNIGFARIRQNIIQAITEKAKLANEKQIWQLQTAEENWDKNTILIAPTGYGKTEFSFLWSHGEKFFYTLPLQSAVNQIFDRARNIFEADDATKVGLLHSDADIFLLGDGGETESLKLYDLARQLSFPVIVSTGDQFFPYALRPPGYEKIFATFSYSRLAIDEVQAYDPKAAAIVVKFLEYVVRMGGKFLLMTATLPGFIESRIKSFITDLGLLNEFTEKNIYDDEKETLAQIKKHKIQLVLIENSKEEKRPDFNLPDEQIDQILDLASRGNRVLVIMNTVAQAERVHQKLNEKIQKDSIYRSLKDHLYLLHSRFTHNHRSWLETKLCGNNQQGIKGEFQNPKDKNEKQGKILVATQVVEASLDLDADIMFTEIAPLDSLVQRMGRVLRRFRKGDQIPEINEPNIVIFIFQNGLQSGLSKVYDRELLGITLKLLSLNEVDKNGDVKALIKDWNIEFLNIDSADEKKLKKKKDESAKLALPTKSFFISEYEKYQRVKDLYDSLSPEGKYLQQFYQTIDILDAGYMSDRKAEAQRMFREISNINIIPANQRDDFFNKVLDFMIKYENENRLYSLFKKHILSEFVISVPYFKFQNQIDSSKGVEMWIYSFPKLLPYEKRLEKWVKGIYFVEIGDNEAGPKKDSFKNWSAEVL